MYGEVLEHEPDLDGDEFLPPGADGRAYLRDRIDGRDHGAHIRAAGLKAMYSHARNEGTSATAWDYLAEETGIAVVHLVRRNLLESFASLKLAHLTGEWHRKPSSAGATRTPAAPLVIDPAECERYFARVLEQRSQAELLFRRHRSITVEYESDLCADFARAVDRIHAFLGVRLEDQHAAVVEAGASSCCGANCKLCGAENALRGLAIRRIFQSRRGRFRPMTRAGDGPRFIQLGHPRSGSSLLMLALMQHPEVVMFGEVFHEDRRERQGDFAAGRTRTRDYRDGEDAAAFLRQHVFFNRNDPTSANGCKVFYEHARADAPARKAWDFLLNHRDIKVIHLMRPNLLDCVISHERAVRSGQWIRIVGRDAAVAQPMPFRIEPRFCHGFFESTTCWMNWAKSAFEQHDVLELEYARDLGSGFQATMTRVYDFIGVAPCSVRVPTAKQRTLRPSQQIANYAELKDYFRNTPFENFFVDRASRTNGSAGGMAARIG